MNKRHGYSATDEINNNEHYQPTDEILPLARKHFSDL